LTSTGRRKENRQQEVSEISRELKILAKDLNIPVIALSQLSREIEHRNPPVPVLSDLRDSGSIEQDADLVMCMYRGDIFEPHTNVGAKLLVLKQRNGPTGQTASAFAIHWWGVKTTLPKPHKPWDINASHHKIWGIFPLYVALLLVEHPYAKQDPVNSPHMYRNRWRGLSTFGLLPVQHHSSTRATGRRFHQPQNDGCAGG
jgi:hypothetical protein